MSDFRSLCIWKENFWHGRSQKFVFGGIKIFEEVLNFNTQSCSTAVLTSFLPHKSLLVLILGVYIYPYTSPVATPLTSGAEINTNMT